MRVCICSFTGYKQLNGSNLRAYFLAKEFLKRGFDLRYVVPGAEDAKSVMDRFGVDAVDVNLDINRFKKSRLKTYPIFAYKASKKIRKNFDLVFGQSLPSALAVNRANTNAKKVVDYVDLWSEYWLYANPSLKGRLVYRALRRAENISMEKVDLVFTITNKLKEMIKKRDCREEKIQVVRDGVDLKMFYPFKVEDSFFSKYNLNKKDDYIIYQGGIAAHDGVQFLVNAAPFILKNNQNIKFLIVGTGDYLPKIKKQVNRMGLNKSFIFTGWVEYGDMPSFMNLAKVNVVPLPNSPATQGVVTYKLMEGIACGTPTVIGDLPGVRGAVRHRETAYLAVSEDRQALANGISELMNDHPLYTKIKNNGFKMIQKHDWRDIAKEMVDVMESALF